MLVAARDGAMGPFTLMQEFGLVPLLATQSRKNYIGFDTVFVHTDKSTYRLTVDLTVTGDDFRAISDRLSNPVMLNVLSTFGQSCWVTLTRGFDRVFEGEISRSIIKYPMMRVGEPTFQVINGGRE